MSSYLDWKVGDRVVCLDDRPLGRPGFRGRMDGLRTGDVYTIRSIEVIPYPHPLAGNITIKLKEIVRPTDYRVGEIGYGVRRFRKVQPRKTSIAIFEAILHGARVPEDA